MGFKGVELGSRDIKGKGNNETGSIGWEGWGQSGGSGGGRVEEEI